MLKSLLQNIPVKSTVIQVGDFGIWPALAARWKTAGIDRDVYFIDGNHDYMPWLETDSLDPVEIWPHAIYVPRAYTKNFGSNLRILFLGGSKSVDRAFRRKDSMNHGWFESEQLTEEQAQRAIDSGPADVMITHTPPDFFIRENFHPSGLEAFGHDPATWVDESSRRIEKVWRTLGQPRLFCGHMHKSVIGSKVRILDTAEVLKLE